ncbi:MAG: flagellar hook-length control protein FliK [Betaproteobacteria bacterium]|jgi:hypothetical protein
MISKLDASVALTSTTKLTSELDSSKANSFVLGRTYLAEVFAKFDDESATIKINDQLLNMKLPGEGIVAGQQLKLRLLNDTPNLTFLLDNKLAPSLKSENVDISHGSTLINQFLDEVKEGAEIHLKEIVAPLTQTPKNPQVIAQDLKQAISMSGLFYESHLADYVEGKRAIDLIKQEPQNGSNFDPSLFVSQQLDVYENKAVAWSGPIWPGQNMSWVTSQTNSGEKDSDALNLAKNKNLSQASGLSSTLELDLPKLGKVIANITMSDGTMRIQIGAGEIKSERVMKSKLPYLAASLQDIGIKYDSLDVHPYMGD